MKSKFTYIIVEDEPLQQDRLKGIMDRRLDWEAICLGIFDEPSEAYKFLKAPSCPHINIMFLDMALPDEESGLAFINSIKEMRNDHWILIVSSHHQAQDLYDQKINHLVGDYVCKPYNPKEITRAVTHLLSLQVKENPSEAPEENIKITFNYTEDSKGERKIFLLKELLFFRASVFQKRKIDVGTING